MEAPAVVALVLLALALGAAFGAWCAWPKPLPPPAPPAPAPEPPPEALAARARFLELGRAAAQAWHETPTSDPEATARLFAGLVGDGWALGVGELRAELVARSALPPAVVDHLTALALGALEARQRQGPMLAPWPAWAVEARRRAVGPAA